MFPTSKTTSTPCSSAKGSNISFFNTSSFSPQVEIISLSDPAELSFALHPTKSDADKTPVNTNDKIFLFICHLPPLYNITILFDGNWSFTLLPFS